MNQVALLVKDLIDGKYPEEVFPWYNTIEFLVMQYSFYCTVFILTNS
jgi:hypothetical protein